VYSDDSGAGFNVVNQTDAPREVTLCYAKYDDTGKMAGINYVTVICEPGKSQVIEITAPENGSIGKVMLLDELSMKPVIAVVKN